MGRFTHEQKYNVAAAEEELRGLEVGSASESTATELETYAARRRSPVKVAGIVTAGLAFVAILGLAVAGRGATAPNGSPGSSLELLSVCPEHPTDKLTQVCACGATPDCAANKYCYGRRVSGSATCEDQPLPCSISTTEPILLDCMCEDLVANPDATPCTLTEYCYVGNSSSSKPSCQKLEVCIESTTTKHSDPYCNCGGTPTDAINPYCYDGNVNQSAKPCPHSFSESLVENCECGSTSPCAKGRYCYGSETVSTFPQCNAEPKACPESTVEAIEAAKGPCKCGSSEDCAVGKYCYDDMCYSNPKECPESPDAKLASICKCGATMQCQKGNYCYSKQCEREPEGTVVKTGFTVTGIDFAKLEENQNILADFQVATRDAIAKTATHDCTKDHVVVTLSAGSVKVAAKIAPPPGISAGSVESSLVAAGSSLGTHVVNEIDSVANIATVKTGDITVTGIETPKMETPQEAAAAVSMMATAAATPLSR